MMARSFLISVYFLIASFTAIASDADTSVYIEKEFENFRKTPNGDIIVKLPRGTKLSVIEDQGDWTKVSLVGYIWKGSTTITPQPQIDLSPTSTMNRPGISGVCFM